MLFFFYFIPQILGLDYLTRFYDAKPSKSTLQNVTSTFQIYKDQVKYTCLEYNQPTTFNIWSLEQVKDKLIQDLKGKCFQWENSATERFNFCPLTGLYYQSKSGTKIIAGNSNQNVFLSEDSLKDIWTMDNNRVIIEYKCDPTVKKVGVLDMVQLVSNGLFRITYYTPTVCNIKELTPINLSLTKCFKSNYVKDL